MSGRSLYLECSSGISGDMAVAALLDLGADRSALDVMLDSISYLDFDVSITETSRSGIRCTDFDVTLPDGNPDHDTEYLHGKKTFMCRHGNSRGIADIRMIIEEAECCDEAKFLANQIFDILAEAESKVHSIPIDQVHFHEVGAVDSIVDILSFAVCFASLDFDRVIITGLSDGQGTVRCRHGVIPVPVPATVEIAERYGLDLRITDVQGELVTPTGAAIAAAVRTDSKLPPSFVIKGKGCGSGKRDYDCPELLRAFCIESPSSNSDRVCILETNIDDCTGEAMGHAMSRLMEEGAKDVVYSPVYMKKNRPGYLLKVICDPSDASYLEQIIFTETTTLGIRRCFAERAVLSRKVEEFDTSFGRVRAKVSDFPDGRKAYPEYDDVVRVSDGLPFREVYGRISDEINRMI